MWMRTPSTIIVGLLLTGPSGSAQARVTAITFEPESPVVGHSVTAIATDGQKHEVTQWVWTCTLADAGTSNRMVIQRRDPGRATLELRCGGTYTVSLRVTYGGPMPPPPETVSVTLVVARPDGLKIIKGIDTPIRFPDSADTNTQITIRSQVQSRQQDAGENLLGMAQWRVRNKTWWNGKKDPDRPWQPAAPGPMLSHSKGVIQSWVVLSLDPADWAKIRPGEPIVTWDEDLRLLYEIGPSPWQLFPGRDRAAGKSVTVECPLGTRHLSSVKVDEEHWAVREGVRARAVGP